MGLRPAQGDENPRADFSGERNEGMPVPQAREARPRQVGAGCPRYVPASGFVA
jgi:hypothetical protein